MVQKQRPGGAKKLAPPEHIERIVEGLKHKPIISSILDRLSSNLPGNLYYHAYNHTEDVLREVVIFSLLDGLNETKVELLAIAAAYHDAGYMQSPVDNERIGAAMATEAMRDAGSFNNDDIAFVEQLILDTKLIWTEDGVRQVATTELSPYLLDADLSNFGRDDFFEKGELQRKESGFDRELFLTRTLELLKNHSWHSRAARLLREKKKRENLETLKSKLEQARAASVLEGPSLMSLERLNFLARLPLLLNSSLDPKRVIAVALEHLREKLLAEAASVFLLEAGTNEITFWAMKGGDASRLEGRKMPAGKGIVGWVIDRQESLHVPDVQKDPRFFSTIDKEGNAFVTKEVICVPLTVRGSQKLGAVQVLNRKNNSTFVEDDLHFVEQFSHQLALSIDNAMLYERLSERNQQLELLDRRKNQMIGMISHEFRTPLNVIQTSADLLSSGLLSDETAKLKMSETLVSGVQRLTKLVSQVRDLSLVSTPELQLVSDEIDISTFTTSLEERFLKICGARKLSLEVRKPKHTVKVKADASLLMVVLKNLLSNAVRFTPDGGKVSLVISPGAGMAEFKVIDTGIGIEPAQLTVIFEKFYEVTDVMQHSSGEFEFKSSGLGLGLATSQGILGAHGSTIHVKSVPGVGSEFSFHLPLVD